MNNEKECEKNSNLNETLLINHFTSINLYRLFIIIENILINDSFTIKYIILKSVKISIKDVII